MITKWMLQNFKSAGSRTELDFSPITIFAGANNSGKSTIIHSILLTAQTVQSRVHDRPLVLNGNMVRLGDYSDIVFGSDKEKSISIGFNIELGGEKSAAAKPGRHAPRYRRHSSRSSDQVTVTCEYQFTGIEEPNRKRLTPKLQSVNIGLQEYDGEQDDNIRLALRQAEDSPEKRLARYNIDASDQPEEILDSLQYSIESIYPVEQPTYRRSYESVNYLGAELRHFLPNTLTVVYDRPATVMSRVVNALTSGKRHELRTVENELEGLLRYDDFRDVIIEAIEEIHEDIESKGREQAHHRSRERFMTRLSHQLSIFSEDWSVEELHNLIGTLPTALRGNFAENIKERKEQLWDALSSSVDQKYQLTTLPLSGEFRPATTGIHRHFAYLVRYLGPLRDEPKSVYPLAGSTDPTDVGLRGEDTAAVLDINRNESVRHVIPSDLEEGLINVESVESRLEDAVKEWLDYMGVGEDLQTVDRGKLGHELNISTGEEAQLHDLSQVGVGVSQVLPILVSALLADPGSTLIYEQPELHLHPKVQARLADFIVAMSQLGKQCVIETHSEYMINRLRYQIAKSHGTGLAEDVAIYFAEKEGRESQYRSVEVDRFGAIENWPKGFFDQGERMTASIIDARMEKRKSEQD